MRGNAYLERAVRLKWEMVERQRQQEYLVQQARRQGATWTQIGAALGMTRQAAHQRFGKRRGSRMVA